VFTAGHRVDLFEALGVINDQTASQSDVILYRKAVEQGRDRLAFARVGSLGGAVLPLKFAFAGMPRHGLRAQEHDFIRAGNIDRQVVDQSSDVCSGEINQSGIVVDLRDSCVMDNRAARFGDFGFYPLKCPRPPLRVFVKPEFNFDSDWSIGCAR
jgi:hypothetical protein